MCNFIILLLLLGNTNRRCGRNCRYENDYSRSDNYDYGRSNDGDCGCDDDDYRRSNDDYRRSNDDYRRDSDDYRRDNDRDCGCSACEEAASESSPIKEREDIWSSYMNTSSGRQYK